MSRWIFALCLPFLAGCAHNAGQSHIHSTATVDGVPLVHVSPSVGWQPTGFAFHSGDTFHISASGLISTPGITSSDRTKATIGPAGTYLVSERRLGSADPLPTGEHGPAPAYALIGRIGSGPPFLIGNEMSLSTPHSGELCLRVNDSTPSQNTGAFQVAITRCEQPIPAWTEQLIAPATSPNVSPEAAPPSNIRHVVLFYVDGLRPDVVRELALTGHLPMIRSLFLDGGTWIENTMTVFPSSTLTANASMWTGCFPDHTGLTTMIRFNRQTRTSKSHLTPLGPVRAGETLTPIGVARVADQAGHSLRQQLRLNKDSTATAKPSVPLFRILQDQGTDWATGILPLMPHVAPPLWSRSLLRHLPWLRADRAWEHIDEANTTYAIRHLLAQRRPVTVIWLPETDSVSHKCGRGQFGSTRRTLVRVDGLIRTLHHELRDRDMLDSTAFMLVSDHGHEGGRTSHLQHFDVAHEVFFKTRHVTPDGHWAAGGGLGVSVHQHQLINHHPGDNNFVFVDGLADGTTRIYLPRGSYTSGDWSGPLRPADLLSYRVASHLPPVNLLHRLLTARASVSGRSTCPVDLLLVRNTADSLLILSRERGAAVIRRHTTSDGHCRFNYRAVDRLEPASDGSISYSVLDKPQVDPLGLLEHYRPPLLAAFVDETTWLTRTLPTRYPDSVVTLARSVLWQPEIHARAEKTAPDVVLTAREGWFFGRDPTPGTMHGYPTQASMRATWFISGPGIRQSARLTTPCRLTDLTPTILHLLQSTPATVHFDGRPLQGFLISDTTHATTTQSVPWNKVLLTNWASLEYAPRRAADEVPRTVNQPGSPADLNTVIHNLASIPNWSPLRIIDDVLGLGRAGSVTTVVEHSESFAKSSPHASLSDASGVINISDIALSDYSPTSAGNLYRVDRLIDWAQGPTLAHRDETVTRFQRTEIPSVLSPLHQGIDRAQDIARGIFAMGYRWTVQLLDDELATSMERGIDAMLNAGRHIPAERVIAP